MTDRHRDSGLHIRPAPAEVADARRQLEARGREIGEYLRACLKWVAEHPEVALGALAEMWPEPRPRGRPSSGTPDAGDDAGASEPA